jgi:putative endonuclease
MISLLFDKCYDMGILFWKKKKTTIGQLGEKIAAEYLNKKGYKILTTNFKNAYGRRLGEIDIIAERNKEIVFVEVKTRESLKYQKTLPEENITPKKLHRLNKIAHFYIRSKNLWGVPYRFDAISVWIDEEKKAKIKHLESIFF